MKELENSGRREIIRNIPFCSKIREGILRLEKGAKKSSKNPELCNMDIPDLRGRDYGLYARLGTVAESLKEEIVDEDEVTKEILTGGKKGLHKKFTFRSVVMVKEGSPLQMSATLTHELGHHFTGEVTNEEEYIESESTAEGVAFVVTDYYGLNIGSQAFPYIAGYNNSVFSPEVKRKIEAVSVYMINRI